MNDPHIAKNHFDALKGEVFPKTENGDPRIALALATGAEAAWRIAQVRAFRRAVQAGHTDEELEVTLGISGRRYRDFKKRVRDANY